MKEELDDVLKEFNKKARTAISKNKKLWEGNDLDQEYSVDIHIWRHPGMGNSIQTIAGNKLSIMTATSSYLQTLLDKKVITEQDLDDMIQMIKEVRHHVQS